MKHSMSVWLVRLHRSASAATSMATGVTWWVSSDILLFRPVLSCFPTPGSKP